jgi:flagellar basal body rod protein FlgG
MLIAGVEDGSKLDRINSMNLKPDDDTCIVLETGMYQIQQGYLEESIVNPVHELSAMIQFSSDFESFQKMMNSPDDSFGKAIEIGKI